MDTLLFAKQDLSTFSPTALKLLAKSLGITPAHNLNDLCWLIAIKLHRARKARMNGERTEEEQDELDEEMIEAAENGHLEVVRELLKRGADIHYRDDEALLVAAVKGNLELVHLLLDSGANVNARDDMALRSAAAFGHLEIVRLVLQRGANVHALDDDALCMAAEYGYREMVQLLLQNGADVDKAIGRLEESEAEERFEGEKEGKEDAIKLLWDAQASTIRTKSARR